MTNGNDRYDVLISKGRSQNPLPKFEIPLALSLLWTTTQTYSFATVNPMTESQSRKLSVPSMQTCRILRQETAPVFMAITSYFVNAVSRKWWMKRIGKVNTK